MNALLVLVGTIIIVALGYRFYASRVNATIIRADPKRATPATMYNDGVDFMPASGSVLFGYQFKSIAALGPIVGPILAAQWGWLPALLWLVIGVFFIGWVQDYASIMLTIRNEGMTMGGLSYKLISPRARSILLSFLYFYLLLIMAAFGGIVAGLMARPEVPIGFFILVLAGILAGQMTYRWRQDLLLTTIVTVAITSPSRSTTPRSGWCCSVSSARSSASPLRPSAAARTTRSTPTPASQSPGPWRRASKAHSGRCYSL